ncbi:MAG: PAS domain S-box protein [Phycisphaerales bacterium]|nr:PAS domain S-box protein [Phycisphaerales bacterium]
MILLLAISLAFSAAALGVAVRAWAVGRDWRLSVFALVMLLLAIRRAVALFGHAASDGWAPLGPITKPDEIIGLASSLGALGTAALLLAYLDRRREAERRLGVLGASLADSAEAVLITEADLGPPGPRIVFVNEAMCRLSGYPRHELLGRTPRMLQGDQTDRRELDRLRAELSAGRSFIGEAINHRKDGSPYWVRWSVSPVRDAAGRITHYLSVQRDETAALQARRIANDARTFLSEALDALSAHIAILDDRGVIVEVNRAWREFAAQNGMNDPSWGVGSGYVAACENARGEEALFARAVGDGIGELLAGRRETFTYLYPCHSPREQRWFVVKATRFRHNGVARVIVAHENVTELKIAEEALRRSERHFRQMVETAQEGVWLVDEHFSTTFVNTRTADLLGVTPSDMLGRHITEFMDPDARSEALAAIRGRAAAAESHDFRFRRADGSDVWAIVSMNPIADASGKLVGSMAMITDITARRAMEQALRDREERLRRALAAARMGEWELDIESGMVSFSPELSELFGFGPEELRRPSASILEAMLPGDREEMERAGAEAMASGRELRAEFRVRRPDGRVRWLSTRGQVQPRSDGGPPRMSGITYDVTDRREAMDELRRSQQRMRHLVEQSPMAVIVWDTEFRVVEWNASAERIFGWPASEAAGRHARFIVPEAARPYVDDIWSALLRQTGGTRATNENVTREGRTIVCEWFNAPLVADGGTVYGVASLVQDVTEREQAERQRKMLTAELDHRVKNNMAVVVSVAERTIAASRDLSEFADAFMGRMRAMARVHAMLAQSRWQGVPLAELVAGVIEPFRIGAAAGVTIEGDSAVLPAKATTTISFLLHELATNAAKYGALASGRGRLDVRWTIDGPGSGGDRPADGRRLVFVWEESGVEIASPPARRGFGTELIESAVRYELGGRVTSDFRPGGLRVELELPLDRLRKGDGKGTMGAT